MAKRIGISEASGRTNEIERMAKLKSTWSNMEVPLTISGNKWRLIVWTRKNNRIKNIYRHGIKIWSDVKTHCSKIDMYFEIIFCMEEPPAWTTKIKGCTNKTCQSYFIRFETVTYILKKLDSDIWDTSVESYIVYTNHRMHISSMTFRNMLLTSGLCLPQHTVEPLI